MRFHHRAVPIALAAVLIDTIGFGIILPVLPSLIVHLAHVGLPDATRIGGYMLIAFAAAQFLAGPVLGNLGDRFGRRVVLLAAMTAFSADYALMAAAPTIGWLFLGRVIAGITGATYGPVNAVMADVTPPEKRGAAFGVTAIAIVVAPVLGPTLGGYITGRLRTRWVGVHTDEVFFRDTAHGFLAWCVATIIAALFLSSVAVGTVTTGVKAAGSIMSGAAQTASAGVGAASANGADPAGYLVDTLFRPVADQLPPAQPAPAVAADARGEALRIVASGIANGEMPDADKAYLARLVASRTGIPAADAETRVNDMLAAVENAKTQAKEAADAARKAASTTMLLGFLALVIGAFISAVAAALAGRLRDEDVPSTT